LVEVPGLFVDSDWRAPMPLVIFHRQRAGPQEPAIATLLINNQPPGD